MTIGGDNNLAHSVLNSIVNNKVAVKYILEHPFYFVFVIYLMKRNYEYLYKLNFNIECEYWKIWKLIFNIGIITKYIDYRIYEYIELIENNIILSSVSLCTNIG